MTLTQPQSGLAKSDWARLAALRSPQAIQDFLDTLPMNWERSGETLQSPQRVLETNLAHCIEGALLAATALWLRGEQPLIMNLSSREGRGDVDHVVALYKRGDRWGAISKTNHATIRFRDPVYKTLRELALSYFHEWFLNTTGEKTLECYSRPYDLSKLGTAWITSKEDLWPIAEALGSLPHTFLVPKGNWKHVRRADPMELRAGRLEEWPEDVH